MGIIAANQTYETVRPQGRIRVLNMNARTLPKAGKNGTASQYGTSLDSPASNVPTHNGNTFGNNDYRKREAVQTPEKHFGQRSNVAIATGGATAPRYTETKGPHPNAHFFDVARQVKRAPTQPGSPNENYASPAGVFKGQDNQSSSVMPHQRNGIGANQGKNLNKRAVYRAAAGGANKTLPSDTPFHKTAVRRQPSVPQTVGVTNPPDYSSNTHGSRFAPKVSWSSRASLWYDPNNSFQTGATSTATGRAGTGRWNVIKRGAAG